MKDEGLMSHMSMAEHVRVDGSYAVKGDSADFHLTILWRLKLYAIHHIMAP
jgi:hypothetical protein